LLHRRTGSPQCEGNVREITAFTEIKITALTEIKITALTGIKITALTEIKITALTEIKITALTEIKITAFTEIKSNLSWSSSFQYKIRLIKHKNPNLLCSQNNDY
jgi:hypothetical protein